MNNSKCDGVSISAKSMLAYGPLTTREVSTVLRTMADIYENRSWESCNTDDFYNYNVSIEPVSYCGENTLDEYNLVIERNDASAFGFVDTFKNFHGKTKFPECYAFMIRIKEKLDNALGLNLEDVNDVSRNV